MSDAATHLMASPFAQQLRRNLEPLLLPLGSASWFSLMRSSETEMSSRRSRLLK